MYIMVLSCTAILSHSEERFLVDFNRLARWSDGRVFPLAVNSQATSCCCLHIVFHWYDDVHA